MNEGKEKIRNYDEINKRNDIVVGASVASFSESAIGEGEYEKRMVHFLRNHSSLIADVWAGQRGPANRLPV